ncbi:MAG: amidohydrolase family protein [Clostridia bacterium]|nr:amidohydrolase family protein [Clostridia bacterium]
MKIIDFHTHVYPEKIAQKATENVLEFYGITEGIWGKAGTSKNLIECGKKAGIENYVILPVALKAENVRHVNQSILNELAEHEEFFGFGTVHAEMDEMLEEVQFIEQNGLKGVKIHPDTQRFAIDDERLFEMYDYLQDRIPMFIHCGDPRYDYSHPQKLKRVLENFPRLTVIGAHLGGWMLFDEALEALKSKERCFVDISSSMMFMPKDNIYKYISGYGAERVLFGSDFPIWDPGVEAEKFLALDIPFEAKEKIAYKNALKILKEN